MIQEKRDSAKEDGKQAIPQYRGNKAQKNSSPIYHQICELYMSTQIKDVENAISMTKNEQQG